MTKMKRLPRYLNTRFTFLCLLALCVMIVNNITLIQAEGLTPEGLLAEKEKELKRFVDAVEVNARTCDGLNGCSSTGVNCSRLACYKYGTRGDSNFQCLGVANNSELCGPLCKERNFDYSKGFVRRVDTVNMHISRTICTHRTLDDHFKSSTMNDSAHLFRAFFGAVDGTARLYPGVDENCNNDYDPRMRSWFLESISVPKGVTLLIDSGPNMRAEVVGGNDKETYFIKAINTALNFLKTLTVDTDFVNIVCFDGDGTLKPPNAKSTRYNSALYRSFSDNLTQIINSPSTKDPSATDTSNAINDAISELKSSIQASYLKVVLVLTSGISFNKLADLAIPANSSVNLFVYSFRTRVQQPECNSTIGAYSDGIPYERFDNPLYALHSYYSFLAKIHRSFMGNQTDYGQKYEDASRIDDHTLTLSKAAFGPHGELLGVVGIDFFEKKVEEQYHMQFQLIVDAANNYPPKVFDASKDLNTSVCFNPTDACTDLPAGVDGLCQERKGDAKIGCCGRCKAKKSEWGKVVGGAVGGLVGLLVLAAAVHFMRPCIAKRMAQKKTLAESPNFVFQGPDNAPAVQADTGRIKLAGL